MMLDLMEFSPKAVAGKCRGEQLRNLLPPTTIPEARAPALSLVVRIDRDMVHIGEVDAGCAQATGDRLRGKPGPILDAPKRSSSAAATSAPSRTRAADESA